MLNVQLHIAQIFLAASYLIIATGDLVFGFMHENTAMIIAFIYAIIVLAIGVTVLCREWRGQ